MDPSSCLKIFLCSAQVYFLVESILLPYLKEMTAKGISKIHFRDSDCTGTKAIEIGESCQKVLFSQLSVVFTVIFSSMVSVIVSYTLGFSETLPFIFITGILTILLFTRTYFL